MHFPSLRFHPQDVLYLLIALTLVAAPAPGEEFTWELVPLRTAKQKARGFRGGEMGQMAFTFTVCRQDPRLMALGIDTAAVYISEDEGRNWQLRRRGIHSNGVQSVAFDPVNKKVLWAAGLRSAAGTKRSFPPDPKYFDAKADGIYRSDDLGRHWTLIRNAAFLRGHGQNQYFAFAPYGATRAGCRTVYALTHSDGLLKTEDGGTSWTPIGPRGIIGNAIIRCPDTGWLWLAADQGLWLSTDEGNRWQAVSPPGFPVAGIAVPPHHSRTLFVALGKAGVWRTKDAGVTWTPCEQGLRQNVKWVRLAISPANPKVLYADATRAGGAFPYYSHDGGLTWHGVTARESGFLGSGTYWAEGLATHPTHPLTAFHLFPLRRTTDGGATWRLWGSGISGCRRGARTTIAFRPDDPEKMAFFFTDHGCALTQDGGDTWVYAPAPRQADLGAMTMPGGAYDPTPGSRTLVSAVGGWTKQRLCLSRDDGKTWKVWNSMVDNYVFFAWHPQRPKIVYAGTISGGLRSDDGGQTWTPLSQPLRAMFRGNGDVVFAVSRRGNRHSLVLRSPDRGETWSPVGKAIPYGVSEIDVDPHDPDRVYAATYHGGIYVFDGKQWRQRGVEAGLERDFFGAMIFQRLAVDPCHPNVIYAGQNHCWRGVAKGIFRSVDYGRTWTNISGNLGPDLTVWAITVSPHDGTVWLGTDYGNWRLPPWNHEAETVSQRQSTEASVQSVLSRQPDDSDNDPRFLSALSSPRATRIIVCPATPTNASLEQPRVATPLDRAATKIRTLPLGREQSVNPTNKPTPQSLRAEPRVGPPGDDSVETTATADGGNSAGARAGSRRRRRFRTARIRDPFPPTITFAVASRHRTSSPATTERRSSPSVDEQPPCRLSGAAPFCSARAEHPRGRDAKRIAQRQTAFPGRGPLPRARDRWVGRLRRRALRDHRPRTPCRQTDSGKPQRPFR